MKKPDQDGKNLADWTDDPCYLLSPTITLTSDPLNSNSAVKLHTYTSPSTD